MEVSEYIRALQNETLQLGDHEGIIDLLFEAYNELQKPDEHINQDFKTLSQALEGMAMEETDRIMYAVCDLCQDHQRDGFTAGIKVAVHMMNELK